MTESKPVRKTSFPFSFHSTACNLCDARCCRGPKGYIWITKSRAIEIAESLNMTFDRFSAHYLRLVCGSLSLREVYVAPHEYACIALDQKTNQCTIYEHRPEQCRSFPFWPEHQETPERLGFCGGVILDQDRSFINPRE